MDFIESLRRLEEDVDNFDDFEQLPVHAVLERRFRNTLYLGKAVEGISLPVADVAVDLFQNAAEKNLGTFTRRHVAKFNRNGLINPSSSLLGMMYARRLKRQNSNYLKKVSSTELFLVSMMLATKFLYDEGEDEEIFSDEWADSAKIDVKRVNELEREFLDAIDWDLYIKPDEYYEFLQGMETWIALREGERRGWFSYSDLGVLMDHRDWHTAAALLLQQATKVLGICIAVYSLCSATLCWSLLVMQHRAYPLPGLALGETPSANRSHVFHGVLPLKATQPATHQSELLLPTASAVESGPAEVATSAPVPAPCPSCRQYRCSKAPRGVPSAGECPARSGLLDSAACEACCPSDADLASEEELGDFWLRRHITTAHHATAAFYRALVLAYFNGPKKEASAVARQPGRDGPQHHRHGTGSQSNRSVGQADHNVPTLGRPGPSDVTCPRLAASGLQEMTPDDNVVVPSSGIPEHLKCSASEGSVRRRHLRETLQLLLPSYGVDSAIGLTSGTIPVIGA